MIFVYLLIIEPLTLKFKHFGQFTPQLFDTIVKQSKGLSKKPPNPCLSFRRTKRKDNLSFILSFLHFYS